VGDEVGSGFSRIDTIASTMPTILPIAGSERPLPEPGPPPFEKIAIVGLGLIGGSIAIAARRQWPSSLVIAVDDKAVLERAMVMHAIDVAADDLVVIREADLIVLAAPVAENLKLLGELDAQVPGAAVVTDTGSTKRATMAAALDLPERLAFIGGHPLGGAARGGLETARADLFVGRPWLLPPPATTPDAALERLRAFVTGLGATPREMAADAHDHLLAFLSHLPQLTASALMQVVGEAAGEAGLALSGRGLRDTTRLASSPPGIWQDICRTNADEIGAALDVLIGVLQQLRTDLDRGQALERVFEAAATWKRRVPQD